MYYAYGSVRAILTYSLPTYDYLGDVKQAFAHSTDSNRGRIELPPPLPMITIHVCVYVVVEQFSYAVTAQSTLHNLHYMLQRPIKECPGDLF